MFIHYFCRSVGKRGDFFSESSEISPETHCLYLPATRMGEGVYFYLSENDLGIFILYMGKDVKREQNTIVILVDQAPCWGIVEGCPRSVVGTMVARGTQWGFKLFVFFIIL